MELLHQYFLVVAVVEQVVELVGAAGLKRVVPELVPVFVLVVAVVEQVVELVGAAMELG
jgi:hypothetical protein